MVQKIGRLSKDELERMTGSPIDEQEHAMLSEVRRKPDDGEGSGGGQA